MNNRLFLSVLALVALSLAAPRAVAQGNERAGTAAMEELLVPVTARTVSLGAGLTSGLDNLSGIEAVQSNPAALLSTTGTAALFSRSSFWADIGINYVGVAQRLGNNTIALSLINWDYGDIPLQTETSPEIDPSLTWSASSSVLGLSVARQFTDRIAAGVTVKGLNRQIDDMSGFGLAFDAGMTYVVGESGLRFGVSLKNFGAAMTFGGTGLYRQISVPTPNGSGVIQGQINDQPAELPSLLNFGVAYTRNVAPDLNATLIGNFRSNAYDQNQYTGGVEVGFQNLLFVRGGLDIVPEGDQRAQDIWNIGAGLNLGVAGTALGIDYAYRPSTILGGINTFTVNLTL